MVSRTVRQRGHVPGILGRLGLGPGSEEGAEMTWRKVVELRIRVETRGIELAGAGRRLEVDPDVSVQVALVAGAVLTHGTHEGLLPGVDLDVTVQERLPHKPLPAARPGAGVALAVDVPGVRPHVRLPVEHDAAAGVGRGEPLVHGDHVPLEVVPPIGLVLTLRVSTSEGFIIFAFTVAVRRCQLGQVSQTLGVSVLKRS